MLADHAVAAHRDGVPAALPNRIAVIVPAHNEAEELPGCLAALDAAVAALAAAQPAVTARVYVVVDACSDGTADLVRTYRAERPWARSVVAHDANVGVARHRGVSAFFAERDAAVAAPKIGRAGAARSTPRDRAREWISFSDADSRVPRHWLVSQLAHAARGADVVIGTVEPRAETASPRLLAAWRARHDLREGHAHVFGANLGIRASWYDRVGGCDPLATGEDAALVAKLRAAGAHCVATDTARVRTSARLSERAPDGFAAYCRRIVETAPGG